MSSPRTTWPHVLVAVRALLVMTVLCGIAYPLLVTGLARAMPARADGSLVTDADGAVVGSSLLGQSFTDADGAALPQYVQSRPSAAGDGYDAAASSGSNLGPENPDLVAAIEERRAAVADLEGVDPADVPVDALTASASGLDPHISPEYADLQVARVARERGLSAVEVRAVIADATTGPDLGVLGQESVNVLEVNVALDRLAG
ncbi:potassium-transporting ATPase subunit KdpC [Cellulomonas triticagri]|uniref:Potassium-transporting ATPase KdpC subunit n=1 Tax=Cellulomonas triticagri TaxID=2483352 RepID=A0A3M2JFT9_9CELL|nr:potassium-transporting ATPase subunit KdpC [Cellulomonas triticagri]RMI09188.1 potassium-transporting ATPase subunit KdpC [Cellulomonas triticagri]